MHHRLHHRPIILTIAAALLATLMACGAETGDDLVGELEVGEDTAAITNPGELMTPVNDPECEQGAEDVAGLAGVEGGVDDPSTQASCVSSNCWNNGQVESGCNGPCSHRTCTCSNVLVCCDGVCSTKYICRWGTCRTAC